MYSCLYNSLLRACKDDTGWSVESRWRFRGRVVLQLLGMTLFEKLRCRDRGEEAPILARVLSWSILPLGNTRWKLWSYAKSK